MEFAVWRMCAVLQNTSANAVPELSNRSNQLQVLNRIKQRVECNGGVCDRISGSGWRLIILFRHNTSNCNTLISQIQNKYRNICMTWSYIRGEKWDSWQVEDEVNHKVLSAIPIPLVWRQEAQNLQRQPFKTSSNHLKQQVIRKSIIRP